MFLKVATLWRVNLICTHYSVWVCLIFRILFISFGTNLPWGAMARACPPASCLRGQPRPAVLLWACHRRPEARLVPGALGSAGWGRGGVQRRGPGEDILVCFPPPQPPPPRRLDHWLTFSPAPKVLRRHWVCILLWLSSLLFPGDGEGGNFGGVGEKWGPWRRGPSRWAAGAPGKRWKEGRRAGRPVLGEGG